MALIELSLSSLEDSQGLPTRLLSYDGVMELLVRLSSASLLAELFHTGGRLWTNEGGNFGAV